MKKICVVLADYYKDVANMLLEGATKEILDEESNGIIKKVCHVPGVFEIPVTISKLINKYDAVEFVKIGSEIVGGKGGGGRSDFAQAGGIEENKIDDAFDKLKSLI